jgi:hypothetical protein
MSPETRSPISKYLVFLVICCYAVLCFAMTLVSLEEPSSAKGMDDCGLCCDVGAGTGCSFDPAGYGVAVCPVLADGVTCELIMDNRCYTWDVTYVGDVCTSDGADPSDNCAEKETTCGTYARGFCLQSYDDEEQKNGCSCRNFYEGPASGGSAMTCSKDSWDLCD